MRLARHAGRPSLLLRVVRPMAWIKAPALVLGVAFGAAFWIFTVFSLSATKLLVAAGVLCRVLAGTKLNAVIGCAALSVVYVVVRARQCGVTRSLREALLGLALPTVTVAVPWYVKSAIETGNPVYPHLYDTLGGIEWSEGLARQFDEWHLGIGMGREPVDYMLLPFRVFLESGLDYNHSGARLSPPREFRRLFRDLQVMRLVFEVDRFELFELLPAAPH